MSEENVIDMTEVGQQQQEQPVDQNQQGQQHQTPSAEEIAAQTAKATAEAIVNAQQQQQQQQASRELTPEDIAKLENAWDPDDNFVDSFHKVMTSEEATLADRKKAFLAMRDGMMNQARTIAKLAAEAYVQPLQQQLGPVQQMVMQRQSEELWKEFSSKYPTLKEYQDVVGAVAAQLRASGYQPQSRDAMYEQIAKGVESLLKKSNPNFSVGSGQGGVGGMPAMATTNVQGGQAVQSPSSKGGGNGVAELFD